MTAEFRSVVVDEPVAIIEARGALVLAQVLAYGLRDGLSLKMFLLGSGLLPAEVEAGLAAAARLCEAGERRLARLAAANGGSAATGRAVAAPSITMTVAQAAPVLELSERRVRDLAGVDLPASKVGGVWLFSRGDVLAFAETRRRARTAA